MYISRMYTGKNYYINFVKVFISTEISGLVMIKTVAPENHNTRDIYIPYVLLA